MAKDAIKLISQNKKAYHDYFILETFQCGIALTGTEVKSVRAGRCNLKDSYVMIENGEARAKCFSTVFISVLMNRAIYLIMTLWQTENCSSISMK